ncbi:diphthine--ammonia ligase [Clostridium lundense]|uniref:Dph6-related ATP pyrophosphatase n=1 Tax=Clostridium lundense TaxID=319475 RepID=UPI00048881B9|nr:diphthine--ammonia ligase [Clostridium lundense]
MNKNCFVSWSGGKDSCLALYKAIEQGYTPKKLFTMFSIENDITSAHRLREDIIKAQADAIEIENLLGKALFDDYEKVFISNLKSFKEEGMEYGIFGDIDLEEHKEWEDKVCEKVLMKAVLPLWQRNRKEIVKEFLDLGFKAKIVVVNTTMLPVSFLGKDLSYSLMREIEEVGADVCGENGEYHTIVYDGPIFKHAVELEFGSDIIPIEKKWAKIEVVIK